MKKPDLKKDDDPQAGLMNMMKRERIDIHNQHLVRLMIKILNLTLKLILWGYQ